MQRYFADEDIKERYQLPTDMYKHAIRVMRMRENSEFELVDKFEQVHKMRIIKVEDKTAWAQSVEIIPTKVELPLSVSIACGISKNDKVDLIVQKGTEMGAAEFIFFISDYSVAKWDSKRSQKKVERLSKIARSAAEQSHRTKVPKVVFVNKLTEIDLDDYDSRVVAYEKSAKEGETSNLYKLFTKARKAKSMIALFGPEGGISPQEITYLKKQNFVLAGLGPRIMRAETAPLYFLASLSFALELS